MSEIEDRLQSRPEKEETDRVLEKGNEEQEERDAPPDSKEASKRSFTTKLILVVVGSLLFIAAGVAVFFILYVKFEKPNFPDNPVVFHMVTHSHDDLGWLVTERQYSDMIVTHILRSSTKYLQEDSKSKFSFCNIGFLKHWTDNDHDNIQRFKQVVQSGQMEILNGGLAVHDNAASYFDDIISTYEYGREFVKKHFNYNPRTGWLIDPFGLSLTTSRLYAEMGYDQYVMSRVPEWERQQLRNAGQLHQYWRIDGKPEYSMFTTVMADHYCLTSPMDVDYSIGSSGSPMPIMNILDPNFNLDIKMVQYLNTLVTWVSWFNTPQVMIPFGTDFSFRFFGVVKYLEEAILLFSKSQGYTGRYVQQWTFKISSADEYFRAVQSSFTGSNATVSTKLGDHFPYITDGAYNTPSHKSWTGYYVSTPYAKKVIRSFGEAVRGLKSLLALWTMKGGVDDINVQEITSQAERSHWFVGINTHHDTITGTSRLIPSNNYVALIDNQYDSLNATFNLFFSKYVNMNVFQQSIFTTLIAPYHEQTEIHDDNPYMIISQGGSQRKLIRFQSFYKNVIINVNDGRQDTTLPKQSSACNKFRKFCEHVFFDNFLTGQGKTYRFFDMLPNYIEADLVDGKTYSVTVNSTLLKFGIDNGTLNFQDGSFVLQVELHQYLYNKDSNVSNGSPGKYIFTSSDPSQKVVQDAGVSYYTTQANSGGLDIYLSFGKGLHTLNFKYIGGAPATHKYSVRLDSLVMTVENSYPNVDYVVKYFTPVQNGVNFVTDSNGLEKVRRVFGINTTIIDENYYPLTRFISIEDSSNRFTVMVDRAQGGSSTQPGMVEVMFNRRTEVDDDKGANEGISEPRPISLIHYLIFEPIGTSTSDKLLYRQHQVESDNPMIVLQTSTGGSKSYPIPSDYAMNGVPGIDNPLMKVLFDRRNDGRLMVRFYNLDEYNTVSMDLMTVLRDNFAIKPSKVRETGIDFNYYITEMNQWEYKWIKRSWQEWQNGSLTLKPLQIRTFEIWI